MSKDLRQFLQVVREAGPEFYMEAKRSLKPEYEVCVLQEKLAAEGRFPVVYCPEIEGSELPLVTNVLGSYESLGMAFDISPERFKTVGYGGIFQEYRRRRDNLKSPKEVPASEAPVREVVLQGKDADMALLPIIHHAEGNSGKYITTGMTICKDPDTGIPNVGIYRGEVKGRDQLGCCFTARMHGTYIAERYAELGKPMEVVTFIGHHPAVLMGALASGPLEMNELEVMGALLGEPLEITPALTVDLPVPARAEIVIEGIIDPDSSKMTTDGPFSEAFGYYAGKRPCRMTQITAITMRKDAIYEDCSLYPAQQEYTMMTLMVRESKLYDMVKGAIPKLKAVHYGPEGVVCRNFVYVSITKTSQDQVGLAGSTALGADINTKVAVVVDDDIDVYNEKEVLWAISTRVRGDLDISIMPGMLTFDLNPCAHSDAGTRTGYADAQILIDATRPLDLPFPTKVTAPSELWDSMKLEDYLK
ncbi:UbiD family decarboxylase [Chloroflexota bacterium]